MSHPAAPTIIILLGICTGSWEVQYINPSHMEGDVQKSASFGVSGLPEISSYNNREHDTYVYMRHLVPSMDLSAEACDDFTALDKAMSHSSFH